MKRFILLSAALMLGIMLSAQTQEGYVKTKGRMVDGQLVPGQGLKGATVCIKGKTAVLVKADNGAFSFPVTETQFRVDSVRKNGYQLVDMDALSKTYKPSANPIYLVMETPEQQLQDQLAAERRIRRTLTNQLHQKEDEIETLKEQQRISDEEYRQALQKLYEETDQNEQLVKDMVERYSTIDYDQLSEFDQRISELILNGELTKADSMLRTKGDINERVEQYRKHEAINAKEKEELTRRQASLKQSETAVQMERDDLANDCYRKFEIFKMQHLNDSAAYYIELRASLDTMNVKWLIESGRFIESYIVDYQKALEYYKRALHVTQLTCDNCPLYGRINQLIGNVYLHMRDLNAANHYYQTALTILLHSYNDNDIELAALYNNIGILYLHLVQDSISKQYLEKALSIRLSVLGEYHPDVAESYLHIGSFYGNKLDFNNELFYLKKALSIYQSIGVDNSPNVACTHSAIGITYITIEEYDSAMIHEKDALDIFKYCYGEKHPEVAEIGIEIGMIYTETQDYINALNYTNKAIETLLLFYDHDDFQLAVPYTSLADIYYKTNDYYQAISYYEKVKSILLRLFPEDHPGVQLIIEKVSEAQAKLKEQENEPQNEE